MSNYDNHYSSRLTIDFSRIETRIDEICRSANERLQNLISDERLQIFSVPVTTSVSQTQPSSGKSEKLTTFEIRLGTLKLSLNELQSLSPDEIRPLTDSPKGEVQIWTDGRLFAYGVLLVVDDKLAVRIERICE